MFISMQKHNFIIHFFLEILKRNSKIFTLGNLGVTGHKHLKSQHEFEETFDIYLQAKKSTSSFMFSLRCQLGFQVHLDSGIPILGTSNLGAQIKSFCESKHSLTASIFLEQDLNVAQILQASYFGYFEYAWSPIPKVVLSTCRKHFYLSVDKKPTSPPTFSGHILQRYKNFLFQVGSHRAQWVNVRAFFQFFVFLHFLQLYYDSAKKLRMESISVHISPYNLNLSLFFSK